MAIKKEFLYLGWYLLLCIPVIIIYVKFSMKANREWLILTGRLKPVKAVSSEKRKFIRLESAFPVEFQKVKEEDDEEEPDIHQGFTTDVSREGMSIEALMVHGRPIMGLAPEKTKLKLFINIPTETQAIVASATVKWVNKSEETTVDRYSIGVLYDDLPEPDLAKIMNYAVWFRRKPDILAILVVMIFVMIAVFFTTTLVFEKTKSSLEKRIAAADEKNKNLKKEADLIQREKEEIAKELLDITQKQKNLREKLKDTEEEYQKTVTDQAAKALLQAPLPAPLIKEEAPLATEEKKAEEEPDIVTEEEALEPVAELRPPALPSKDEIVVEPNITRGQIEAERDVYKTFRDYILKGDIQLLDSYCSLHRGSIYHAGGLFALGELRYKSRHIKEMTMKAYTDVIKLYPDSKYASYASHRLEQIDRNLAYETYALSYFCKEYNLPPLFDYRELEPYKD